MQMRKAVLAMGRKRMRRGLCAALGAVLCLAALMALCLAVGATESADKTDAGAEAVSPALHILAARSDMAVATLCGNDYYFSRDVFARALNVNAAALDYITVTAVPSAAEGELVIGSATVQAGQIVSGANLAMMCFVAADDSVESVSTFSFSPCGAAYEIDCCIHVLKELNYSPTVRLAGGEALSVSTHRDFAGYGTLTAYDPEGDALTFEVVRSPRHGLVIMTDASCGEYVYLPRIGYTGEDRFVYVARDEYGNYSTSAEVSVSVSEPSVSVSFADMAGRRDYNAALTMAELGIMQGEAQGEKTYFYPERTVSRLDFLTMAMQAIGIGSVPEVTDTGFYDDADVPSEAKGYVAAAYSLGYVKGSADSEGNLCFLPDATVTRAEAAVILRRMVDAEDAELTPAFADASDIPAWASEAISTLSSLGVIEASGGHISPNTELTRGETAMMLSALGRLMKE